MTLLRDLTALLLVFIGAPLLLAVVMAGAAYALMGPPL